jgi:dodecin
MSGTKARHFAWFVGCLRRQSSPPRSDEKEKRVAVIKTIDLVGVSDESWRDAAEQALAEASRTIRGISGMEVLDTSCNVSDGQITEYLTHVRIKFRIER